MIKYYPHLISDPPISGNVGVEPARKHVNTGLVPPPVPPEALSPAPHVVSAQEQKAPPPVPPEALPPVVQSEPVQHEKSDFEFDLASGYGKFYASRWKMELPSFWFKTIWARIGYLVQTSHQAPHRRTTQRIANFVEHGDECKLCATFRCFSCD